MTESDIKALETVLSLAHDQLVMLTLDATPENTPSAIPLCNQWAAFERVEFYVATLGYGDLVEPIAA